MQKGQFTVFVNNSVNTNKTVNNLLPHATEFKEKTTTYVMEIYVLA
jgi:hypothetical protein